MTMIPTMRTLMMVCEEVGPPSFLDELQAACERHQVGFYFEEGGCWGMALALHDRLPGSKIVVSYRGNSPSHAMVELGGRFYDYSGDTYYNGGKLVEATPERLLEIAAEAGYDTDEVMADKDHAIEIIDSI